MSLLIEDFIHMINIYGAQNLKYAQEKVRLSNFQIHMAFIAIKVFAYLAIITFG